MRGSIRIIMTAAVAVCMFALTATSAFAVNDQLLTEKGGVELRDITTPSANQPSAIELVTSENTKLEVAGKVSECTEGEFGAFVTGNKGATDPAGDPALSVPFGVFENCTITGGAFAPVYVDTEGTEKAASMITATINDDGAPNPNNVVLKGLKLSLYIAGTPETICKFTGEGTGGTITGAFVNGAGPFTEESATNQTAVDFKGQKLTSPTCGKATITSAKFFVETTSDAKNFKGNSDTVFFQG